MRRAVAVSLVISCGLACGLTGCESVQRKFTRRSKKSQSPPTPIINFQDYTQAMTPLDRYRKHALIFDYWNGELSAGLSAHPLNPKRYKHASSESLGELQAMQSLLSDEMAARMSPVIEQRVKLNRQLQSPAFGESQSSVVLRTVEQQTLQIHREFFWRDVEDELKPPSTAPAPPRPDAGSD